MSEYQYYEFRALDAPLTSEDQRELREISTRARITSRSFTNEYTWGDLKADPEEMLLRWFDALLYVTNWGSRWLGLRFPRRALPVEALEPYACDHCSIHRGRRHVTVVLRAELEESEWLEHEELLDTLLPIREALIGGDHRALYLTWLAEVPWLDDPSGVGEPPVPAGLGELDESLQALVRMLELDADLLAEAMSASAPLEPRELTTRRVRAWLKTRTVGEKDRWLQQLITGDGAGLGLQLRRQLLAEQALPQPTTTIRGASELLDGARARHLERTARLDRERAERRRLSAQRQAEERARYLDGLLGKEIELWSQIEQLVATTRPKAYDQAVDLIVALGELAVREGTRAAWSERVGALRQVHQRKSSLLKRLDQLVL